MTFREYEGTPAYLVGYGKGYSEGHEEGRIDGYYKAMQTLSLRIDLYIKDAKESGDDDRYMEALTAGRDMLSMMVECKEMFERGTK